VKEASLAAVVSKQSQDFPCNSLASVLTLKAHAAQVASFLTLTMSEKLHRQSQWSSKVSPWTGTLSPLLNKTRSQTCRQSRRGHPSTRTVWVTGLRKSPLRSSRDTPTYTGDLATCYSRHSRSFWDGTAVSQQVYTSLEQLQDSA
jgi:hypothetical protein